MILTFCLLRTQYNSLAIVTSFNTHNLRTRHKVNKQNHLFWYTFLSKFSHLWVDQSIEFVTIFIGQVIRLLSTNNNWILTLDFKIIHGWPHPCESDSMSTRASSSDDKFRAILDQRPLQLCRGLVEREERQ
jgi:hypothetical protein